MKGSVFATVEEIDRWVKGIPRKKLLGLGQELPEHVAGGKIEQVLEEYRQLRSQMARLRVEVYTAVERLHATSQMIKAGDRDKDIAPRMSGAAAVKRQN